MESCILPGFILLSSPSCGATEVLLTKSNHISEKTSLVQTADVRTLNVKMSFINNDIVRPGC